MLELEYKKTRRRARARRPYGMRCRPGLTEIGDGSDVPGDLILGVLPEAGEEVYDKVDGSLARLWVDEDAL